MSIVNVGDTLPSVTVRAAVDRDFDATTLKNKKIVLYFYPKDSTPGCTLEGQDFRDHYRAFRSLNTEIFGVSRDSIKSHINFREKQGFPFGLISDADEQLCRMFDVIKEKNLYGRIHMGIERSTFIIDDKGVLRKEFRKVKVAGHVQEVLQAIKAL
jgi:peroxiredoxin Q/BCP